MFIISSIMFLYCKLKRKNYKIVNNFNVFMTTLNINSGTSVMYASEKRTHAHKLTERTQKTAVDPLRDTMSLNSSLSLIHAC